MEQEFDVEIKEVLSRVQKVKAESLDDAINKAMDMYYAEHPSFVAHSRIELLFQE